MRRALAVLVPALTLACGGEVDPTAQGLGAPPVHPVPGCEAHDHRPCDVRTLSCQERLMGVAACLRGASEFELPPVTVMTEVEFAEYLNGVVRMLDPPPDPNPFEAALVLLRLAVPGDFDPQSLVENDVEFIYGLYRWEPNDIIIVDHGEDSPKEVSSAVLVHEFIHALADREVDLAAFSDEHATSIDSSTASNSLVEGEAQLHELRYASAAFGYDPASVDFRRLFQNVVEDAQEDLLFEPSLFVSAYGRFPYVWGGRFAHFAWQAGGPEAILERYASPPLTTRTLFASDMAAEVDLTISVELPVPVPPAEWVEFTQTSLGAWGLYLASMKATGSVVRAHTMAFDWRADRLFVYQGATTPADTVVVWRIAFGSDAGAEAAAEAFALLDPTRQGSELVIALSNTTAELDWAFGP